MKIRDRPNVHEPGNFGAMARKQSKEVVIMA
jgi:hypothetical protein